MPLQHLLNQSSMPHMKTLPSEEAEIGDPLDFEGGDEEIVAQEHQEIAERNGDVIDVDSDDDEHVPKQDISCTGTLKLYSRATLDLLGHLRMFRGRLQQDVVLNAKQTTINSFFK
ncbi:hypothetical protein BKA83DRAFT_4132901 [Pisolithus microcarpus]|nr:hypothetical protein BKA83DRAFT_4132901 [Pisolithus microcarpus]